LAGTVHTAAYRKLLTQLVEARDKADLSQAQLTQLAQRIGKPASFVGKYELGERRLDVIELLIILRSLGVDSGAFMEVVSQGIPKQL